MAEIIDGKSLSLRVKDEVRREVDEFQKITGFSPSLHVILVGNNPASEVYVRNKRKSCEEVGIASEVHHLPEEIGEGELLDLIENLNSDKRVHGILLQLPLPSHLNADLFISRIDPLKDVDGFHPENLGLLAAGTPRFIPCTPYGILRMLEEYSIPVEGADVVMVGRSRIVGRPMALLLLNKNATVTVCHSKTREVERKASAADILIVGVGKANFVNENWVKPGACVIDVGINRTEEGKLTGDVNFESVKDVAGFITPVPGGVGPMTVAMLLKNALKAAKLQLEV